MPPFTRPPSTSHAPLKLCRPPPLLLLRTQVVKEFRSIAPFLIPFLKMAAIYFVLWLPSDQPSPAAAFVKCLPILSLIWFVWLQGTNAYNLKILAALVLSCAGDALLVTGSDLAFIAGMGCFGAGHLVYTLAFGLTPFGVKECVFSGSLGLAILSVLLPCVEGVFTYAVVGYAVVLWLMGWRALARFSLRGDIPWRKIYAACGALLFVFSDTVLAVNKFCWSIPFERELVMVTYYAAQLCISLSVLNSRRLIVEEEGKRREGRTLRR